ncbi:MAG: thioredoxin domain-containing protein [Candidatus Aminicenantales bacterium]|jgi:thioredoxin 2
MPGDKVKVSCLECGTTNYYPLDAQGKKVACGRCKSGLPLPGTLLEPTRDQAYALFQNSGLPVLVDFFSPTCGPCYMMHPVVERLAKRRAGELTAVRVNVDRDPELAQKFGIRAVPTFVVVFKGLERARTSGAMSEEDFALWVASQT